MINILLAQGNQSDLFILYEILNRNQMKCTSTLSAIKAKEIIDTDPSLSLILTSISMPSRSGWEILKYAKQNQKTFYIPVIMTADNVESDTALRCYKMGVSGIITKPFSEKIAIEKIQKALTLTKPTVLIVDDDQGILNLLRQVIELERFKVHTALSAEQGLVILEENDIHAVVSDIILPGKTGVELMAIVKEKYRKVPVILITGQSGHYTPQYMKEVGADGFFTKPFQNIELIRKLKQVMPNSFQRIGRATIKNVPN